MRHHGSTDFRYQGSQEEDAEKCVLTSSAALSQRPTGSPTRARLPRLAKPQQGSHPLEYEQKVHFPDTSFRLLCSNAVSYRLDPRWTSTGEVGPRNTCYKIFLLEHPYDQQSHWKSF